MSNLSSQVETEHPPKMVAIGERTGSTVSGVVVESNLSVAWARAFAALSTPGVRSLAPLVVCVTGFADGEPEEFLTVRRLLDDALAEYATNKPSLGTRQKKELRPLTCRGIANTIFPASLWSPGTDRRLLYRRYLSILPRLKRRGSRRGLYFERLIAYGRGPEDGNQLEHMISSYRSGLRRSSAFQATICDPERDSTRQPRLGFPCLQQIALHPDGGTLSITGFYGTQYLFERAYGNFLGLCWLGRFLAYEMGLSLKQMTCIASYAPFCGLTRDASRALATKANALIVTAHEAVKNV